MARGRGMRIACGAAAVLGLWLALPSAAVAGRPRVLVLHSYHFDMRWTTSLNAGIESVLEKPGADGPILSYEFMDTKRLSSDAYFAELAKVYALKYAPDTFAVILCCDDDALRFLMRYGDALFGPAPIVFCGVNHFRPVMLEGRANITGVVESFDLAGTLNLMRRLHPAARRVLVINDTTVTGEANRMRVEELAPVFEDSLAFRSSGPLTVEELRAEVAALGPEDLVLLMSFNRDREGMVLRYRDAAAIVSAASAVPVYGVWDFYVGDGVVGGKVASGKDHGCIAATMAAAILNGTPVSALPVITESPNRYLFDWRQLDRFGIPLAALPDDSEVRFRPPDVLQVSRRALWAYGAVLAVLLLFGLLLGRMLHARIRAQQALAAANAKLREEVRERRHAEDTLRQLESKYLTVFNSVNDCIYINDGATGELIDANRRALEIFGARSVGELQLAAREWAEPPYARTDAERLIREAVAGRPQSFEWMNRDREGREFWFDVHLHRAELGGHVCVIGVARDITERRRALDERRKLEQQLWSAQKLESLGVMAGGIAHDFNNLLMGILGNASLALADARPGSDVCHHLEGIQTTARRAAELIFQMLTYCGKGKLAVQHVHLNRLVEEMAHLLEVSIFKKILLRCDFSTLDPQVEGDATQMRQVVMNLITNASDAIGDRTGVIWLRTGIVAADRAYLAGTYFDDNLPAGRYAYLEVSDNGGGMDEATVRKIFDPFFTTKFTGRGLGLAAVLGIVRSHHGAVSVQSVPRRGTTVRVLFPLARQQAERFGAETEEAGDAAWTGSGTVLLVDDEEIARTVGAQMLGKRGFRVLAASGGREGVALFRAHATELSAVVLDLTMPDMDGVEVFRAMNRERRSVPIVLTSGYREVDVIPRFGKQRPAAFLQKPYELDALVKILRGVLTASAAAPGPDSGKTPGAMSAAAAPGDAPAP